MSKDRYVSIPVFESTGFRFEELQLDLKIKGIVKTKDDLINFLISFFYDRNDS
jgi:hypothetical protein